MVLSDAMDDFRSARSHLSANQRRLYGMWFELWRRQPSGQGELDAEVAAHAAAFFRYLRDDYRTRRGEPLAASSQLSAWRCLRAFLRWLVEEGLASPDAPKRFRQRAPMPKVEEEIRPTYDPAVFDALIAATRADRPALGARSRALLWLTRESGMRAQEVVGMTRSRLRAAEQSAQIRGKGGRWAWVCWGDAGAAALAEWLAVRPSCELDAVFTSVWPRRAVVPLTYEGFRTSLRRLAKRAGVELPEGATIHALRHTFAHEMLDAGVESLHLQQMMRHKSADMTARYVRERNDKLRVVQQAALRRLRPPGDGRNPS